MIVFLLSAVAFLMWIYRSYANLRPLGARAVRHSPVWAVVVWFIPFANLVLPYTVAKEIAEKSAGSDDRPMGGLVLAWWLAYLAKAVVGWNKRALRVPRSETVSIADIIDATRADQLSELVSIGAAALTILVVRGIEQRQAGRPDLIAAFD